MHHSRHISHCGIPFYITFHITPHSMYSTPHLRSRHILLATLCITPPHLTITDTTFYTTDIVAAPHSASASFHHIISLIRHPIHIPPPCFNIPHHTSVHHHIIHPTTKLSHLAQHHLHYHIAQPSVCQCRCVCVYVCVFMCCLYLFVRRCPQTMPALLMQTTAFRLGGKAAKPIQCTLLWVGRVKTKSKSSSLP